MTMKIIHDPTAAQIETLKSSPPNAPVAALNLFHFNERAQYQKEDPEYGTPAGDISGTDAFEIYRDAAGKVVEELGGRIVFSTSVEQMMIGPEDAAWEMVAMLYFPTRAAILQFVSSPEYKTASRHLKAALANHRMIHLDGEPFGE